ncbi:DUF1444 family protein [Polaribacter butkevichii]|uniref:DUF1444 domain-containing protein n=2 Tax=Polaribacter butkevichii TaxID=218490 RepID=A0A2P6CFS4_9FLAO|nr:hypothetical protein BTO14_10165 [Polaribacter butkevichii]
MLTFFKSKSNLTESEFAEKFFAELKKKVKGLELVSINGLEVITKLKDSDNYKHFLDNSYAEYKNDPKDLKNVIEKYTFASKDLFLPEEPIQLKRIVPVIKDKRYLIESSKIIENFENTHVYEKYNSELYIFYAEDKENTISYFTKEKFEQLNVGIETIKEKAIENLNSVVSKMERHGENGYFMLTSGGDYEASLILFDIWNKENFPVNGNLIIGIPARDIVFITGTNDKDNIEKLKNTINEINESGDHLVSDKIFEFRNGKFELWK